MQQTKFASGGARLHVDEPRTRRKAYEGIMQRTSAKKPEHRQLEAHEIRLLAAEAEVDDGTVRRYLRGDPVRGLSRARIERAMAESAGSRREGTRKP